MAQAPSAVRHDHPRPALRRPDRSGPIADQTSVKQTGISHLSGRAMTAMTARRLTIASAALILAGGYVHFCLYRHGYRFIPKIGVSFLLQAVSSALLAVALVVLRGGRRRLDRGSVAMAQLTRLSGIGLSLGTLTALGIAHTPGGLFQFREIGLRPAPQTLVAIVAEFLATVLLGVALLAERAATRGVAVTPAVMSAAHGAARDAA